MTTEAERLLAELLKLSHEEREEIARRRHQSRGTGGDTIPWIVGQVRARSRRPAALLDVDRSETRRLSG